MCREVVPDFDVAVAAMTDFGVGDLLAPANMAHRGRDPGTPAPPRSARDQGLLSLARIAAGRGRHRPRGDLGLQSVEGTRRRAAGASPDLHLGHPARPTIRDTPDLGRDDGLL
jgi:hypothetical protein